MATWQELLDTAPTIGPLFLKRHRATHNLCLMGTLRKDGYPRISPIEPRVFEGQLWLVGMPGTAKFRDLVRDSRYSLHTATEDAKVIEGDVKLWGRVTDVKDRELQKRWLDSLFEETGMDFRGEAFDTFFAADIEGASSVVVRDDHMYVTTWKPGSGETVIEKH